MYRKLMLRTESPRLIPVGFAAVLAVLLAAAPVMALESDRDQPIELVADSVDIDESKGRSIYKGDVDLSQGSMRLLADIVTVHQDKRKPTRIIAEGRPVKFRQQSEQGPVRGEALRVEYEVNSENLVLKGNAVLVQNKDSMRSDRIVYDRVRSVVKAGAAAKGKQRVRISIEPPPK